MTGHQRRRRADLGLAFWPCSESTQSILSSTQDRKAEWLRSLFRWSPCSPRGETRGASCPAEEITGVSVCSEGLTFASYVLNPVYGINCVWTALMTGSWSYLYCWLVCIMKAWVLTNASNLAPAFIHVCMCISSNQSTCKGKKKICHGHNCGAWGRVGLSGKWWCAAAWQIWAAC